MNRGVVLAALAAGSLALALGGGPLGAPGATALGWASAAGTFLLLMLQDQGQRAMGVLLVALGAGAAATAVVAGGWALVLLVPAVLVALGGLAVGRWARTWGSRRGRGPRVAPMDQWKQFDAGQDPTGDAAPDDVAEDDDPR